MVKKKTESAESTERIIPVKREANLESEFRYSFFNENLNDEQVASVLKRMVLWARKDSSKCMTIEKILRHFQVKFQTFYKWLDRVPEYKAEFQDLLVVFADRRWEWAAWRKLNDNVAKGTYGDYDHPAFSLRAKEHREEQHKRELELITHRAQATREALKDLTPEQIKEFSNPSPITRVEDGSI